MYIKIKMLAAATASLAIAGMAHAQPTAAYLKAAGAGDLYEKTSSQLVLKSTADPKIRQFAQMMVADHTKSTAMVKAAAAKSGVAVSPPMLSPKQQAMVADLTKAQGAARDKLYVAQQKQAHQEALATHQDYSATGDKPALKKAATDIVPVVEHHIQTLGSM